MDTTFSRLETQSLDLSLTSSSTISQSQLDGPSTPSTPSSPRPRFWGRLTTSHSRSPSAPPTSYSGSSSSPTKTSSSHSPKARTGYRDSHRQTLATPESMRSSPDRLMEHFPNALTGVRTPSLVYTDVDDYGGTRGSPRTDTTPRMSPLLREAMGLETETGWVSVPIEDLKTTIDSTITAEDQAGTGKATHDAPHKTAEKKIQRKPVPNGHMEYQRYISDDQPSRRRAGTEALTSTIPDVGLGISDFRERLSLIDTGQTQTLSRPFPAQVDKSVSHQQPQPLSKTILPDPRVEITTPNEGDARSEKSEKKTHARTRITGFLQSKLLPASRGLLGSPRSLRRSRSRPQLWSRVRKTSPSLSSEMSQRGATDGTVEAGGRGGAQGNHPWTVNTTTTVVPVPAPSSSIHTSTSRLTVPRQMHQVPPRFLPLSMASTRRKPVATVVQNLPPRRHRPIHAGTHFGGNGRTLSPAIDSRIGKGLDTWSLAASRAAMKVPPAIEPVVKPIETKVAPEEKLPTSEENPEPIPIRRHSLIGKKGFVHVSVSGVQVQDILMTLLLLAEHAVAHAYRTLTAEKPERRDLVVLAFSCAVVLLVILILRWLAGMVVALASAIVLVCRWFLFL